MILEMMLNFDDFAKKMLNMNDFARFWCFVDYAGF